MSGISAKPPRPRLHDIDQAKGFAILLVVIGHIVSRGAAQPAGNEWFMSLSDAIYMFHMPLFMYLSGIVMFYTGAAETPPGKYWDFLKKRAFRFLLPFVLFGLTIILGKLAFSHFMTVDRQPPGLTDGLKAMFINTDSGPATSIWYVYVMFVYCAIVPPLMWLMRGKAWALLALAAALHYAPLPEYFYLWRVGGFFVFFILGGVTVRYMESYRRFLDRHWLVLAAVFILSLALLAVMSPFPYWELCRDALDLLALPAIHAVMRRPVFSRSSILAFLAGYTFVIYLFNTIFIGLTKGVLMRFMNWDGYHFLIFLPILIAAGILGPVALKVLVLRRIKVLDAITT
ncbi:MAG: acyltransferase [Alphaproteobacteria bacterium]